MVDNKVIGKSKKRIEKILGVFTQTLEQLGKERAHLNNIIDTNIEVIEQAQICNEEANAEIMRIESIMDNISKIVEG